MKLILMLDDIISLIGHIIAPEFTFIMASLDSTDEKHLLGM